jgi:hypothetical protein
LPKAVTSLAMSKDGQSLAVGDDSGYVRLYKAATATAVLDAARKSWQESREDPQRTRDLLLALWAAYLDRKKDADASATELLEETIAVGGKMDDKLRKELAPWLAAFATELKPPLPRDRQ